MGKPVCDFCGISIPVSDFEPNEKLMKLGVLRWKYLVPGGSAVDSAQITRTQIEDFVVSGRGEDDGDVKPRMINQRLAAVRALSSTSRRDNPALVDPTAGIRFARTRQSEALHVTEEHGTTLLNHLWERAARKTFENPYHTGTGTRCSSSCCG